MWPVLWVVLVVVALGQVKGEEYLQFPRLFHLDDYDRCLAVPRSLYCRGRFHLTPSKPDNPLYQALVEHSKDPLNFNRTVVHRGYCVSSRCPAQEANLNQTERFVECVAKWAETQGLKTSPLTIDFCKTKAQKEQEIELDTPKIVFLSVVFCILFLNAIGTAYDVFTKDDEKKSKLALCWSWVANWRLLTAPSDHSDPRRATLLPAHAVRVIILLLVILMHCGFIHFLYPYNPQSLEKIMRDPVLMLARNGTPLVCVFMMLSNFFLANNLLALSASHKLSLRSLPTCLLHRFVRIAPLYMVVVGFSATWWAALGDGPLWATVEAETAICRRKMWTHALFVNNLVDPSNHCLIQTWFLAVDMQLYLVCCILTLALIGVGVGKRSLLLLTALFFGSCVLNGVLAYVFDWQSMLFYMNPENLHSLYRDVASFNYLYIAPWGSLPASILGVLLAYLYNYMQDIDFKFGDYKLLTYTYRWSIWLMIGLVMTGLWQQHAPSPPARAALAAADRPLLCAVAAVLLLGLFRAVPSFARRVFLWRGWVLPSRLSLGALLLHWPVALTALAAHSQPVDAHYGFIIWEWIATVVVTYFLSIPLTLLVEFPVQRTVTMLLT